MDLSLSTREVGDRTVVVVGGEITTKAKLDFVAIAREYAIHGWKIILAARDGELLERNVSDLALRHGAGVSAARFDACRTGEHAVFLDGLGVLPDTAISVVGLLGNAADVLPELLRRAILHRRHAPIDDDQQVGLFERIGFHLAQVGFCQPDVQHLALGVQTDLAWPDCGKV